MFYNKLCRLSLGLCCRRQTTVWPRPRSGSSWAAVRRQRSLRLQESGCSEKQNHAVSHQIRAQSSSSSTVDPDEVRRFQLLASKWWDENGEFAALHSMNDLRVPFIRDNLLNVHRPNHSGKPMSGLQILDVGCGGGLLTEPLARLGAKVLGIDPVEVSINTAQLHASYDPDFRDGLSYQACTLEELSEEEDRGGHFDAVVASEVVEHLADVDTFAFCCKHVLKPGGSLFITTINKTNLSYAFGIVVAERLLRIVPSGTHDWEKFISPVDLERILESNGFSVQSVYGMLYNPVSRAWSWTNSTAINYALHAVRMTDDPQSDEADENGLPPDDHGASTHS